MAPVIYNGGKIGSYYLNWRPTRGLLIKMAIDMAPSIQNGGQSGEQEKPPDLGLRKCRIAYKIFHIMETCYNEDANNEFDRYNEHIFGSPHVKIMLCAMRIPN